MAMSAAHKDLLKQAEAKHTELQALLNKTEFTQADAEAGSKLNGELAEIKTRIGQIQDLSETVKESHSWLNTPHTTIPQPGQADALGTKHAGSTEMRTDGSVLFEEGEGLMDESTLNVIRSEEYKRAYKSYIRAGGRENRMSSTEVKALSEGTDSAGGALVPEEMLNRIISKKPTPTRIADAVTRLNTGRDSLVVPRVKYAADDIYTTGMRVTWTNESPTSATQHLVNFPGSGTDNQFGTIRFQVFTAMLSLPVSNDMIEDSLFPINSWAADKFRETIELLFDNMVLNGAGGNQPYGMLLSPGGADQPGVVAVGNASGAPTADGILSLAWSMPEQYDENCRFIMSKTTTGQAISKLKDNNNRYLWGSGLQDSGIVPGIKGRELVGYPVNFSAFMPGLGANNYPLIFGDPTGYYLITRIGFSVQVLREISALTNQVILLGRIRFGGAVAEPWKIKIGQQA